MQASLPVPASARQSPPHGARGPRTLAALVLAGLLAACGTTTGVLVSVAVHPAGAAPALNLSLPGLFPLHLLLFWLR
jgi:hypothetical protein